jgi:hypothetical protein
MSNICVVGLLAGFLADRIGNFRILLSFLTGAGKLSSYRLESIRVSVYILLIPTLKVEKVDGHAIVLSGFS